MLAFILRLFWVVPIRASPESGVQEGLSYKSKGSGSWLDSSGQYRKYVCLESQHQHQECRSPERQAGTAGHHLAVGLLPGMRSNRSVEMCLSRTGTWSCGTAALIDKEKESGHNRSS